MLQDKTGSPAARPTAQPLDSGLVALVTLLGFFDLPADPNQLARDFAPTGGMFTAHSIVRAAKAKGIKARKSRSKIKRLDRLPLPAIAKARDGSFFILAKAGPQSVLVKEAGQPTAEWKFDELNARWSGDVVLLTRRASLAADTLKFGVRWFLPVVSKYRRLFYEVLIVSFFLQIFALVAPLFSQVVIDKVLVHRGLTTLDVLVIGLVAIGVFEIILGGLRTYLFAHTTSRIDAQLGAKLFKHLLALPIAYFESRQTGQTVARVRELENIRNFLTTAGADTSGADTSGADVPTRHLALDLALSLDVLVDLLAELVRLGGVEVDLLLEDVAQPSARHPDVVQVLHEHERIHRREIGRVVHLLHGRILPGTTTPTRCPRFAAGDRSGPRSGHADLHPASHLRRRW